MVRFVKPVMREGILFLNGNAKGSPPPEWQRRRFYWVLLLFPLVLQSCAVNKTTTTLVPGRELSRSSLGFQETESKLNMKEINPYTVAVRKHVCKTELLSIEYAALQETKQETQTLDCSEEYVNYAARNATSFGLAFLYDSVTGFNLLRDKCRKNPPVYRIASVPTHGSIKKEVYDATTTTCKDIPVAGAIVSAKVKGEYVEITTSAKGIASLPSKTMAKLKSVVTKSEINFHYETVDVATEYLPKKSENPNLTQLAAVSSALGDTVIGREHESDAMAMFDGDSAMKKNAVPSLSAPEAEPASYKNRLAGGVNAVSAAKKTAPTETDMMARLDQESAMKKGGAKKVGGDDLALQPNRLARDVNSVAAAGAGQRPETQLMAKIDDENAAMKKRTSSSEPLRDEAEAKQNKQSPAGSTPVVDPPVVTDKPVVAVDKPAVAVAVPVAAVAEPAKAELVVRFDSNKAVVKKEFRDDLEKIAEDMKGNAALVTVIEGHTDNIGSAEVNRKMSLRRANVIRDYLVKVHGIPRARIQVKGYGLTQPIADNGTEQGRAVNRRTEISVNTQSSGI